MVFFVIKAFKGLNSISLMRSANTTGKIDNASGQPSLLES